MRQRLRSLERYVAFVRFVSALHAEKSAPTVYFSDRMYPQTSCYRHMISDFDLCEVDTDRQTSFLNAAL